MLLLLGICVALVVANADYYNVLNVQRSASTAEIKRAFRLASRTKHPE